MPLSKYKEFQDGFSDEIKNMMPSLYRTTKLSLKLDKNKLMEHLINESSKTKSRSIYYGLGQIAAAGIPAYVVIANAWILVYLLK